MAPMARLRVRLLGALLALPALAQAQSQAEVELPSVQVLSDREGTEQEFDTAHTTRVTAQDITDKQVRNIKDLVRYEPGVSVTNRPSRFGLSGFNIRGLEDNRILMQIDGVRMPDTFVIGGFSNASRDMVDVELLQAIEIERGTGSARRGSDALGGTVSYVTPRPEDLLRGGSRHLSLKSLYQSADEQAVGVATGAVGNDIASILVRGVRRSGQETETKGEVGGLGIRRTIANPQAQDVDAALLKFALTPFAGYRAEVGLVKTDRDVHTHVLSGVVGGLARDMNTWDRTRYEKWSFDQRFSGLALGTLDLTLFRQDSNTAQYTRQDRRPTASPFSEALYQRYFDFSQDTVGARLDIASRFDALGHHRLDWGAEWSLTKTLQLRDGYTTRRNGTTTRSVTVDDFPTRDMPPSDTRRGALFAQNEWHPSEAFTVIAGVRYENYRLTPRPDAIYLANTAAAPATGAAFRNVSPKLGAIWRLGAGYALAGQYAEGFRPPPYDDVNIGFANLVGGYTAVPNPALKAETSRGVELSLRHLDSKGSWALTAFDNRYRDFIETIQLDCPGDPSCSALVPLTFQSQNTPKVRIYGVEARISRDLARGWAVRGAFSYARGRNVDTRQPVYSINPASGMLGLIHTRGKFRGEVSTSFATAKRAEDAQGSNRQFLPRGYSVVDLRLGWKFAKDSQLAFGVYNVFDRLYYHWADVPVADIHIPDSQAGPQRYSQPGRNFALTLTYAF